MKIEMVEGDQPGKDFAVAASMELLAMIHQKKVETPSKVKANVLTSITG